MSAAKTKLRRKSRTRNSISKNSDRLRLSVFRSARHIYAQVIDDVKGVTLVSASTKSKDFKGKKTSDIEAAKLVGGMVGDLAKKAKLEEVVYDKGPYRYHGRVKALAEGAREAGLKF